LDFGCEQNVKRQLPVICINLVHPYYLPIVAEQLCCYTNTAECGFKLQSFYGNDIPVRHWSFVSVLVLDRKGGCRYSNPGVL
jgi:hypothetical protein